MHNRGDGSAAPLLSSGIYAHIVGWGMAVPEKVMTNDDLTAIVETSDEWIQRMTGIKERRIASEKETTATLGLKAAQRALEVADVLPTELGMVVVATSTPENIFPSTASLVQAWLGAGNAGAFDLSAACSGFVYGVNIAVQAIRSGSVETALVVGSETMSRVMDWQDRSTCVIFGDGAGAVVLKASDVPGGVLSSVLRSDGYGGDLLGIPSIGSNDSTMSNGHKMYKMFMNGSEVFKFATRVMNESVPQAVEKAGLTMDDVDLIIPHQANQRIIAAAARALKLEESQFMSNIDRYGNTSAASIPIALCEAVQQGRLKPGDHAVFVGFGGGLSWGSMVVKWGDPRPEEEQHSTFVNRQRRQLSYILAYWRHQLIHWRVKLNNFTNRSRPKRGRMQRLRRKIDRYPLE